MNHSVSIAINDTWCLQFSVFHFFSLDESGQVSSGLKALSK